MNNNESKSGEKKDYNDKPKKYAKFKMHFRCVNGTVIFVPPIVQVSGDPLGADVRSALEHGMTSNENKNANGPAITVLDANSQAMNQGFITFTEARSGGGGGTIAPVPGLEALSRELVKNNNEQCEKGAKISMAVYATYNKKGELVGYSAQNSPKRKPDESAIGYTANFTCDPPWKFTGLTANKNLGTGVWMSGDGKPPTGVTTQAAADVIKIAAESQIPK